MKKSILLFIAVSITMACARVETRPQTMDAKTENSAFYSFKMKTIDGAEFDFSKLKGKKVLLVNTASECGFTPQYTALQELNLKYGDKVTFVRT